MPDPRPHPAGGSAYTGGAGTGKAYTGGAGTGSAGTGGAGPAAPASLDGSSDSPYAVALAPSRALLAGWPAPDPDQGLVRGQVVTHVDEHGAAAFDRDNRAGHLTASTVLLDAGAERVLLTLHPLVGAWIQLGGHVEPGEPGLRVAALREAGEESGIDGLTLDPDPLGLDRHPVSCRDSVGRRTPSVHFDVTFLAHAPAGAEPTRSDESLDLAWFPVDRLPDPDPALIRLVEAAVLRCR